MTLPVLRSSSPMGRWDPLREFEELSERMNRLMATAFGSAFGPGGNALTGTGLAGWTPLADVTETEDAWLVEVEVPGLKRDDITIEATGSELVISGEYTEKERAGWLRTKTRRVGRFEYRTSLPANVDVEHITADMADGVLAVRVPKNEQAKPRRIAITGS
jgi:HSP20 family protein